MGLGDNLPESTAFVRAGTKWVGTQVWVMTWPVRGRSCGRGRSRGVGLGFTWVLGDDVAGSTMFARAGTKAGGVRADLGGDVAPGMGCNGRVRGSAEGCM